MTKPTTTSATSQATPSVLADSWVENIFQRMEDRYGSLWADRYGSFPRDRVKRTWAKDLADLSRDELVRGVAACRDAKFPPTLAEFRAMCRPTLDYERAFLEAVEQMRRRESGKDAWSAPAVYWAAARIGKDVQASAYAAIKARWHAALDEAMADIRKGALPAEVPQRREALPAPGRISVPKDEQQRRIAGLRGALTAKLSGMGGV